MTKKMRNEIIFIKFITVIATRSEDQDIQGLQRVDDVPAGIEALETLNAQQLQTAACFPPTLLGPVLSTTSKSPENPCNRATAT